MDKKNTLLGVVFIAAAIACFVISSHYAPPSTRPSAIRQAVAEQSAAAGVPPPAAGPQPAFASVSADNAGSTVTTLANDFIEVRFTDFGGAIRDVALKKYPRTLARRPNDFFVFNELHKDPMLALVDAPGLDRGTRFQLVAKTANTVVFRAVLGGSLEVTRRYVVEPDAVSTTDPYQIHQETTFRNLSARPAAPFSVQLALGTAAPLNALDNGIYLTTGYSTPANKQTFMARRKLESSGGFFGLVGAHDAVAQIESPGPLRWAAVSSQFFASILTPTEPVSDLVTRRVKLLSKLPDSDASAYGITAEARFDIPAIAPGGQTRLSADFYVGPKEFHRLDNQDVFKASQVAVMQYGFWRFFSGILITLMLWTHSFVHNWGVAIICTTLILKLIFSPFTLMQVRSARRMQKIQPELKALKEKYKDNPQKQQTATMELFKQHKVNPLGGCLPMLLTMPFFIGFYTMLRSTAELRFAPFLWARDLSAPDTIHLPGLGLPINVLPILLAAVAFVQMQITPQPTVDSSQAKMMKFSPVIMLIFYYTYACSLSLYSTTNYIFSIGQQLLINRKKDDGDPTNVTPVKPGFATDRPAYGKGSKAKRKK